MAQLLIKNARIINENKDFHGDVLIANGRIEKIGEGLSASGAQEINADGKLLIPGLIDDQVHFREPGLTHKADLGTESRAAIAGGITSFMEMPNTNPATTTLDELNAKFDRALGRSAANYSFYLGATNDNVDVLKQVYDTRACGVKVFMGSSTGNMLVDSPKALEEIFSQVPSLIATHCEDTPTIEANEAAAKAKFGENVPFVEHANIRSAEACYLSSSMAVKLAQKHNTRLHVLHLSTAKEVELFEAGPIESKRITGEVCAHHIYFDSSSYAERGSRIKWNPSVKTAADRDALRKALNENRLDVIATDHAPHTLDEKAGTYFNAPSGAPLVQHLLPALLTMVNQGIFSLEKIVEKACHNPAVLYGIAERGFIREGYWADLVLVDPQQSFLVRDDEVMYKCGWSPLTGDTLNGVVEMTILNGEIAYQKGMQADQIAANGKVLDFNR